MYKKYKPEVLGYNRIRLIMNNFDCVLRGYSVPASGFPTDNLLAYYRFDETGGSTASDSYSTNNLGVINSTWSAGGKSNYCLYFDATGASGWTSSSSIFDFERTDSFSFSMWIKRVTISSSICGILHKRTYPTGPKYPGYDIIFNVTSNTLQYCLFNTTNSNEIIGTSQSGFTDTTNFHHYVLTYDGSSQGSGMKLYYDGQQNTLTISQNTLTASIKNTTNFVVGNHLNTLTTRNLKGYMDELAVFGRVLSQTDVNTIYAAGSGLFY